MHIVQKAGLLNRAEFRFHEKKLSVLIDDGRLKLTFDVAYHEIGSQRIIRSFRETFLLYSAVTLLFAACLGYGLTVTDDFPPPAWLAQCVVLGLGIALYVASLFFTFAATRIPLASGNAILVFHDGQEQRILSEIARRRRTDILRLYGKVDGLNHPQLELRKFDWLKDEGVITPKEYEDACAKVRQWAPQPPL